MTSTSENAICATTRNRRRPKRSRAAVTPRPSAFMAAPGATWVARSAGASPNSRQVRRASALVKPSTRASGLRSTNRRLASVVRNATRPALSQCASTAPAAAPTTASSTLSAISCRTMRPREAPMASRTAISRSRAVARASIRLARFAQAMSSTSAVMTSRTHSGFS